MSGPKLVPIIGYVVAYGGYDDEGVFTYGPVCEGESAARELLGEARRHGLDDAEVYMLIPPDSIARAGAR